MNRFFTPWRMEYILSDKSGKCFICEKYGQTSDEKNLVLHRTETSIILLNQYPYTNGHLMVAPRTHVSDLSLLEPVHMSELFLLVQAAAGILQCRYNPDGLNIGLNLGKAAGAGLEEHLHVHVLPRWEGDHNFMTVFAETRTVPETLDQTYRNLVPYFRNPKFFQGLEILNKDV